LKLHDRTALEATYSDKTVTIRQIHDELRLNFGKLRAQMMNLLCSAQKVIVPSL